jgi:hypothetical protein
VGVWVLSGEAKQRFLDLLRERFNSGVRYKGRAFKWDTVIEQKIAELSRCLVGRSVKLDFSEPAPYLRRNGSSPNWVWNGSYRIGLLFLEC